MTTPHDDAQIPMGNFLASMNIKKSPGDKKPLFQGKLTVPGEPAERGFAMWVHVSERTGDTLLTGRAGDTPTAQIDSWAKPGADPGPRLEVPQRDGAPGLSIEPHALVLFTNKSKDGDNPNRPDYFGYYNPGNGQLMRLAAWGRTDRLGRALLTGSVQPYTPPREQERDASPAPSVERTPPPPPMPMERPRPREQARARSR